MNLKKIISFLTATAVSLGMLILPVNAVWNPNCVNDGAYEEHGDFTYDRWSLQNYHQHRKVCNHAYYHTEEYKSKLLTFEIPYSDITAPEAVGKSISLVADNNADITVDSVSMIQWTLAAACFYRVSGTETKAYVTPSGNSLTINQEMTVVSDNPEAVNTNRVIFMIDYSMAIKDFDESSVPENITVEFNGKNYNSEYKKEISNCGFSFIESCIDENQDDMCDLCKSEIIYYLTNCSIQDNEHSDTPFSGHDNFNYDYQGNLTSEPTDDARFSFEVSSFSAKPSETITLTLKPDDGYRFTVAPKVEDNGFTVSEPVLNDDGSYTYTLSKFNGDIFITASSEDGIEEISEPDKSPINYISFKVAKPVAGKPAETYGIDESSKSLSITAKTESGETLGTSDLKSYYAYIMEVDTEKNLGGWTVYKDNYVAGSTYALHYDIKTYNEIADDCEVYVNGVKAIAWPEEFTYSGDLLVYERLTDGYGVAGLKGFYVSYPSSSGGNSSSSSSSSDKTEEKVDVKEETSKIENAEKGEKVEVKIEGTVIPEDYIETAMKNDAIVIVSYGEYEWQISDVEEPKAVDLSIDTNAVGKIKKEIVETLEGDNTNVIDIKHNGNLGFKGTLKYNVKKENAGKYVNLYYYNIETGKLELQGSTKIDEKGFVYLPFTHCSTYVLNITSDPATSTLFEDLSAGESIKVEEIVL